MIVQLIALSAAATLFFIILIVFGGRNDLKRRVAELQSTSKASSAAVDQESAVFRQIMANVDRSAIAGKLAEAGWYQTRSQPSSVRDFLRPASSRSSGFSSRCCSVR